MGPSAVRVAGLEAKLEALGHVVTDGGNVPVAIAETKHSGDGTAHYLKEITQTCTKEAELVLKTLADSAHRAGHLARNEGLAATGTLMIE